MDTSMTLDYIEEHKIGLDDTFRFGCRQCGKCCHGDTAEQIVLSGMDLYRIAQYLQTKMKDVVGKYCRISSGANTKLPIITLRLREYDHSCPFLRKGKCIVHDAKPITCAIFPLGRGYDIRTNEMLYIFEEPDCGLKLESHTVREWLRQFGIPENDQFFVKWSKYIFVLTDYIGKKKVAEASPDYSAIMKALFFDYDISLPFEPQLDRNIKTLADFLGIKIRMFD